MKIVLTCVKLDLFVLGMVVSSYHISWSFGLTFKIVSLIIPKSLCEYVLLIFINENL